MQVRAATDYAIRMVSYLALRGEMCSSREIAEAVGMPRDMVVQISICLRRFSIIDAQSGKYGGYFLIKDPKDISVFDIAEAMGDDPIFPGHSDFFGASDKSAVEALAASYRKIQADIKAVFTRTTVSSITESASSVNQAS